MNQCPILILGCKIWQDPIETEKSFARRILSIMVCFKYIFSPNLLIIYFVCHFDGYITNLISNNAYWNRKGIMILNDKFRTENERLVPQG